MDKLILSLIPWIVLFGIMWFFMIRPQQIKNKQRDEMLAALQKGDQIVTIGGIHGTISSIQDDLLRVRIADRVEIKLNRNGVARTLDEPEE